MSAIERLTGWVLRWRRSVLAVWLLALVVATPLALRASALLTNRIALPGTESDRVELLLQREFGQSSVGSFTLVVATRGRAYELLREVQAAADRAAAALPGGIVVASQVVNDDIVVAEIASGLDPAAAKRFTPAIRAAVLGLSDATVYVSGLAATEHDVEGVIADDLRRGELYVAVPAAIVLLILVFRTLTFLLPLLFTLVTLVTTLGLVWVAAALMELTSYIVNFVSLVGFGIAVDYSLLVVHRFREERARRPALDDAIVATMASAGRAVVFSGVAVAIGLALLLPLPLPFLRGFGVGGLLITTLSVLAAATLLPALLAIVGPALERVDLLAWRRKSAAGADVFWPALARWIVRRPGSVALMAAAALLSLCVPLADLTIGPGSHTGLPTNLESARGREVIAAALGAGATTPTTIVVDSGAAGGAASEQVELAVDRLVFGLTDDPEVVGLYYVPGDPRFVDSTGRYQRLQVLGRHDFGARESLAFVRRLRSELIPGAGLPPAASALVGGVGAAGVDFLAVVGRWFPWLVIGVLGATYVLLLFAFRSLLVPLKAVVLNLLSVAAACGVTAATFQWGWGTFIGLPVYDQVEAWIPVMVFTVMFGLSMDYEVFLVSRMREEWDKGASNEEAIALGLARTGRLITSAGLIMFAAFVGFVVGSIVGLQQFGFALAAAILIDVTVVRALLLPATMQLFGRWNWYLPEALFRAIGTKR